MSPLRPSPRWSALFLACLPLLSRAQVSENAPFGLESRTPWTASRVHGTPEPPPPYTTERYLTNVPLKSPIYAKAEPGTRNLVVVLQGGEKDRPSRALRLEESATTAQAEPLLEIPHRLIYGLTFHPRFSENGQLFVFSNGTTGETERTNYVSRFQISRTAPYRCDPASETLLLKWRSAGHDGGDLEFGRDGFLYISTGDGTSDSDGWDSGQTLTDLLGSVLRIDVDHPDAAQPYSIPKDNPFLNTPGARGEIWAYGLRNPWRMTADRRTGHVWVGNNGQDLWETAHFIRRGENYGWSVYEGSHPFYLNRRRGPTPIVAPTIEHHHSEFRSLTGGVVYSGDAFPELKGAYIYGDYATGRIWGARHDGTQLTWLQELATTPLQIAAFALSPAGELIVVDHGGGLHRLVRSQKRDNTRPFPQKLSETGVFEVTADQKPAPGVLTYSVNAPGWTDGARSEHFLAVPAGEQIEHTASRGWEMPDGTVLVQTLSLPLAGSKPGTWTRIETRLFTRQDRRWAGYSYRWNEAQTDATLVEARGAEVTLHTQPAADVAEVRQQTWRFPSRTECLGCHSRAVNFTLSLNDAQMNRDHTYPGGVRDNQLRALSHAGFFTEPLKKKPSELQRLVDPYDPQQDLNQRARSYLHANCSVCHVEAGGGNARMLLEANTAVDAMNLIGARPQHDTFGIQNAMLVAPGAPDQSVVVQRLSRRGRGQMPPLVSSVADTRAVSLFREWIQSLKPEHDVVHEWTLEELKNAPEQAASSRSYESGKSAFSTTGCIQCHRLNGDGGSVGPDLTGVSRRLKPMEIVESLIQPSKVIAPEYANAEIETVGGDKWIGRIELETPDSITLRPAAAEDPVTVRTADIRRRGLSTVSNMPPGILNTLNRDQVLDLLAYLLNEGNPTGAAFKK